jgi:hypothetical protein
MRADICDPSDENAVERFRRAVSRLGAQLGDKEWGIGVDITRLQIGDQELTVFCDAWSLDIEGPDDLVQKLLGEFRQAPP